MARIRSRKKRKRIAINKQKQHAKAMKAVVNACIFAAEAILRASIAIQTANALIDYLMPSTYYKPELITRPDRLLESGTKNQ